MLSQATKTAIIHQSQFVDEPDWACVAIVNGITLMVCGKKPNNPEEGVEVYSVNNPQVKGMVDTLTPTEFSSLISAKELVHAGRNGSIEYSEYVLLR